MWSRINTLRVYTLVHCKSSSSSFVPDKVLAIVSLYYTVASLKCISLMTFSTCPSQGILFCRIVSSVWWMLKSLPTTHRSIPEKSIALRQYGPSTPDGHAASWGKGASMLHLAVLHSNIVDRPSACFTANLILQQTEWIYVKLYGSYMLRQVILVGTFQPIFVSSLSNQGLIEKLLVVPGF